MKVGTISSPSNVFQGLLKDGKLVAVTPKVVSLLDDLDRTDRLPESCQVYQTSVDLYLSTFFETESNSLGNGIVREQPDIGVVAVIQFAHETILTNTGRGTKRSARERTKASGRVEIPLVGMKVDVLPCL
jgi:hypothetical protein